MNSVTTNPVNPEKCIKVILIIILIVAVAVLFMHSVTYNTRESNLQAKVDTSKSALLRRFQQMPLNASTEYYTIPRNPMPTKTNYEIANSSVTSYINGGIIEPNII